MANNIIEIQTLTHPGVEIFHSLTEAQLRNNLEPSKGMFIAESPKVINVALNAGYKPLALLCERKHIEGDAAGIIANNPDIPASCVDRYIGIVGYYSGGIPFNMFTLAQQG